MSYGEALRDDLQHEVRKNLIVAYFALQRHIKMFFNDGIDEELEKIKDKMYAKFLEYIKKFS